MHRILLGIVLMASAATQSTTPLPQFDAASVKPAPPADPNARLTRVALTLANGQVNGENATLTMVLIEAFGLKRYQIQGADWLNTAPYSIRAKAPAGASASQLPLMLQSLLAERFHLQYHRETKEMRLYDLVAGPHGITAPKAETETSLLIAGQITGRATIARLADSLSALTDAPVIDRTNTPGIFDFKLTWESDGSAATADVLSGALQHLAGLKLEAGKGPIEILIVDHADRVPAEN